MPGMQEKRKIAKNKVAKRGGRRLPTRVPTELIADALSRHSGNVLRTSQDLDLNYVILADYIEQQPTLRNLVMKHRESAVDMAEANMREALEQKDKKMTMFVLRTLGSSRGYVAKTQTESHVHTHEHSKVDLDKLDSDQLRDLRNLMSTAQTDDTEITDADYDIIG